MAEVPHGQETFQDRASRCAFQSGLYAVPGSLRNRYMGACLQRTQFFRSFPRKRESRGALTTALPLSLRFRGGERNEIAALPQTGVDFVECGRAGAKLFFAKRIERRCDGIQMAVQIGCILLDIE